MRQGRVLPRLGSLALLLLYGCSLLVFKATKEYISFVLSYAFCEAYVLVVALGTYCTRYACEESQVNLFPVTTSYHIIRYQHRAGA